MRKILFLLSFLPLFGHSQTANEFPLSTQLDESRLGLWEQGNYHVYVKMEDLEFRYRQAGNGFIAAIRNNGFADSTNAVYQLNADRYLLAADQLKNAEDGFDLRKLVVYQGPEDGKQAEGNSSTVEYDVRQSLERGNAVVYYKGMRIYSLKHLYQNSAIGITGMDITIYHDSAEDPVFRYYRDYGW